MLYIPEHITHLWGIDWYYNLGHRYSFYQPFTGYWDAYAHCSDIDADLVTINEAHELEFVARILQNLGITGPMLIGRHPLPGCTADFFFWGGGVKNAEA